MNAYPSFRVSTSAAITALMPPASFPRIIGPSSSGAKPAVKPSLTPHSRPLLKRRCLGHGGLEI